MKNFNFFGIEFNLASEQGLLDLIHKLNASHKDLDSAINAAVARSMELLESPHNNKRIFRLLLESVAGSKNRHIKAKSKKLVAYISHFSSHFLTVEEHEKGNFRLEYKAQENARYFSGEIPAFSQWEYKPVVEEKPATPITSRALPTLLARLAVSETAIVQELRLALEQLEVTRNSAVDAGKAIEAALKPEPVEDVFLTEVEQEAEKLKSTEKVA